jgi:hypothetical protein
MTIFAFHFNADVHSGDYGTPCDEETLRALMEVPGVNVEVSRGDLCILSASGVVSATFGGVNVVPDLESFEWAVESVVRGDLGWTRFSSEMREVLLHCNVYVHAVSGLTRADATSVDAHLLSATGYLGVREVVESDRWHAKLYDHSLLPAFRVEPRQIWLVAEPWDDLDDDAGYQIELSQIFPQVKVSLGSRADR